MEAGIGIGTIIFILLVASIFNFLVGGYAKSKGRSFWLFFFVSYIITPLGAFIVALMMPNEKKRAKEMEDLKAAVQNNNGTTND